jgi:hypothetical protein
LAGTATNGLRLEQGLQICFIKASQLFLAFDNDRPLKKVQVFEHELDGLGFGRWLLLHVPLAVKRRPGIEKVFDRAVADYLSQFLLGERVLAVFPFLESDFLCVQETSCFAASGSRGFVNELDLVRHFLSPLNTVPLFKELGDPFIGRGFDLVARRPF